MSDATTPSTGQLSRPGRDAAALALPGLDGANPLAFLAALGLLRILDGRARMARQPLPRLAWIDDGYWQPRLQGADSLAEVIDAVLEDKALRAGDPALLLAYDSSGESLVDPSASDDRCIRDLKPKPAAMREFLDSVARLAEVAPSEPATRRQNRHTMDLVSAFGSELVQDNNGNTKPTALHFTAGQQKFLDMVAQLQEGVTTEHLEEALLGPWTGESKLPSLSWDSTVARIYALRASDPSAEKRGSVPGADWLAFLGIGELLSTPVRGRLVTVGFRGGWKDSTFAWPLWTAPATAAAARSLLATARLRELSAEQRLARGIGVIFESRVTRSDQGGYGAFTPARVL